MTDGPCPGPHHLCKGCRGRGTYESPTLYVNASGQPGEMMAPHKCLACRGRGFFCKQRPPCLGEHTSGTPIIPPDALPPV